MDKFGHWYFARIFKWVHAIVIMHRKITVKNVKHILVRHPCACVKAHTRTHITIECVEWNCAILLSHKTTNYIAVNKFSLRVCSFYCLGDVSSNKYIVYLNTSSTCVMFSVCASVCVYTFSVCLATAVEWCIKCFSRRPNEMKLLAMDVELIAWKRVLCQKH